MREGSLGGERGRREREGRGGEEREDPMSTTASRCSPDRLTRLRPLVRPGQQSELRDYHHPFNPLSAPPSISSPARGRARPDDDPPQSTSPPTSTTDLLHSAPPASAPSNSFRLRIFLMICLESSVVSSVPSPVQTRQGCQRGRGRKAGKPRRSPPLPIPTRTMSPWPMSAIFLSSTTTEAWRTLWMMARIVEEVWGGYYNSRW